LRADFAKDPAAKLAGIGHNGMWRILEGQSPRTGVQLRRLVREVLCLTANEAHSERTVKLCKRVLRRHGAPTLSNRVALAMCADVRGTRGPVDDEGIPCVEGPCHSRWILLGIPAAIATQA
jgi:hypothetical protein